LCVKVLYTLTPLGTLLFSRSEELWELLSIAYPEHTFLPWKFKRVDRKYWDKQEHVTQFLHWMGSQLGYQSMESWYNVTAKMFVEHGGAYSQVSRLITVISFHSLFESRVSVGALQPFT